MNIKWNEQLQNLRTDPKYKPTQLPANFLDHCLPIISAVKLVKNSAGLYDSALTLQPLMDNPDGIFKTPNQLITNIEYLNMLTFLGGINRSKIVPSMRKDSRLGSLTPLGLYAYKMNFDIPYEAWDKSSRYFSIYIGKYLKPLIDLKDVPSLSTDDIEEYRKLMQTVRTTGQLKTNTDYRAAIKEINGMQLPAPAVYMLLQLWIANAELRKVDSMILDPLHWDNVPKVLDAVVAPKLAKASISATKLWWED